jgi:sulfofructose kinase
MGRQGLPLQLDFSCAAAALNCMANGARGGIQSVAAIEALMAKTPRYQGSNDLATLDQILAPL